MATTTTTDPNIDPKTGLPKLAVPGSSVVAGSNPSPAQNIPPVYDPNQPIQLTTAAKQPTQAQANNDTLLQTAQTKAIQGFSSPTMDMTSQKTQELLKDPNQGIDFAKANRSNLEAFDRNRAQSLEAARQGLGDTLNTGDTQRRLLNLALEGGIDRTLLERQNELEGAQKARENLLGALEQGRATAASEANRFSTDIGALSTVRGMAEGERAQTQGQANDIEKLNLVFGQDMAKMLAQNDWQGVQNQLSRDLQTSMQANDINATAANIQRQIELDKWKQLNGQEFSAEQNALNRALEITLKDKDFEAQKVLVELKGKIDQNQLLTQQDFQAAQAELDRKMEEALQAGDIAGQVQITKLKGEIDAAAQKADQEFSNAQRIATQAWQTEERLGAEDFQKASQYLDVEARKAMQSEDIAAQKYIAEQKNLLDLRMQVNNMRQEERMIYLNAQLTEAKANGDVARQKTLYEFQTTQDLKKIYADQGFQAAQNDLNRKLEESLRRGDWAQAQVLQRQQLTFQAEENEKNRALDVQRLALEGQRISLAGQQLTFDQLQAGIESGAIDPQSGANAVAAALKERGITVDPAKVLSSREAIAKQYDDMRYQFGLTNPTLADEKGNLTPEGEQAFNAYINKTTTGMAGAQTVQGVDENGKPSQVKVDFVLENAPMNKDGNNLGRTIPSYWDATSNSWIPINEGQVVTFGVNMHDGPGQMDVPKGTYRLESGYYVNVANPSEKYPATAEVQKTFRTKAGALQGAYGAYS